MVYNFLLLDFYGILVCFIDSTVGREAIVGGDVAQPLQFPYQVTVLVSGQGLGCGGGIINNNTIVTAASCVIAPDGELISNPISVLVGTTDLQKSNEHTVIAQVVTIYVPREYDSTYTASTGDIAVLRLRDYIHLSRCSNMKNLKLPLSQRETFASKRALVAGFGWHWVHINDINYQSGGRNDTRLRFAEAEILSTADCERNHRGLLITNKHLCARIIQHEHSPPRGICVGDGGGPLVYNGMVIGIFSLGSMDCSERTYSSIYTRVSHFLVFIRRAKKDVETSRMRKISLV